jgi:hypothetical protein
MPFHPGIGDIQQLDRFEEVIAKVMVKRPFDE